MREICFEKQLEEELIRIENQYLRSKLQKTCESIDDRIDYCIELNGELTIH